MKQRMMLIKEKMVVVLLAIAMVFAYVPVANAMHIMEGYISPVFCIAWGVIVAPFILIGFRNVKKIIGKDQRSVTLLAMAGAFVFLLSSLKIPSVTGSCSHMTGTGLAAILFGPMVTSVLAFIVLIFQALLLAHGGVTTLGANTFSMGVAGPILTYVLYKSLDRMKVNRKVSIFAAAFLGDLLTYCVTAIQLAIAHPSEVGGVMASAVKFLGIFAPTQVPLAIIEGILTVVIYIGITTYAEPEMKAIGFVGEGR